jgi:membrane protease YdiL (CAAX protease family)
MSRGWNVPYNTLYRHHERRSPMTTPFIAEKRSPLKFFLLVFALSIPFWLIGAVIPLQVLPGLPVSSLMAFCPLIAASILVYREDKTAGVTELLKRSFDYRRIRVKAWYIPTVLLMPGITVLSYGLMRLMRLPLPTPQFPVLAALAMFLAFFVAALGEEVGWVGYAIDPMQDRWNALQASLLLGLVWAAWHIIPLVQVQRSPAWLAWWCLFTVALRVLIVWIYNNTGKSVFAAALCHAMANVSWQLFPNYGSHWDPRITGLITALAAVIVTVVWGPRTLTRNRNG